METQLHSVVQTQTLIESNLKSLISVVERQRLDQDESLSKSLEQLKLRASSKEISLAVLGEFSAGKTTFINALLNSNILDTGILPTTAVCTYISYGPEPACEVLLKNGQKLRVSANDVGKFSVEGARNAEVHEVTLRLPSRLLSEGLIIVDTPGVNVNIDTHEAITICAISNANACVYVMDARQPGKKTTIDFLRRIHGTIDKFFFVLNRADILDEDEQREAREFVATALNQECGISEPRVVLLSSTFGSGGEANDWRKRFRSFEQEISGFMQAERQSVISAELARLLDRAIAFSGQLLESKHRLIEQELSAHYRVSLPDAAEILAALREQTESSIASDASEVRKDFPDLHQTVCRSLRDNVKACISSAHTTEELVSSVPQQISNSFEGHASQLQRFLSASFENIFSRRQAQVAATVRSLFSGVRWVEQKAFFSRPAPWIAAILGAVLVLGAEFLFEAPKICLILAPILGAAIGSVAFGVFYWAANRESFSPPVILSLAHAGYAQAAITSGSVYQDAAANPVQPSGAPMNVGRAVGNFAGNPWFAVAGAAISAGIYGFRLLWDKVSGRLDKLRNEIRESVMPVLDDFEEKTRENGLTAIDQGQKAVLGSLSSALDKSVERYQVVLNRLIKPHRQIKESLERRRTEIRADAEMLLGARQQVLEGLRSLEVCLKGVSSRAALQTDALCLQSSAAEDKNTVPRDRVKLLDLSAAVEAFPASKSLMFAWLGSLAVVLVVGYISVGSAIDAANVITEPVSAVAVTPTPQPVAIPYLSPIAKELASAGFEPVGDSINLDGVGSEQTVLQKANCTGVTDSTCQKVFLLSGGRIAASDRPNTSGSIIDIAVIGSGKFNVFYRQLAPGDLPCCPSLPAKAVTYTWDGHTLSSSDTDSQAPLSEPTSMSGGGHNEEETLEASNPVEPNPRPATAVLSDSSSAGTWTDPATGLMWTARDNGSDVSWNEAINYCASLTLGGYAIWRLPTINELAGIYDESAWTAPAFSGGRSHQYYIKGEITLTNWQWSATRTTSPGAWVFKFSDGTRLPANLADHGSALCVRRSRE